MAQSEAARKRDERARALGFTSYGQQYRASKRGYTGQGREYNAAMRAQRDERAGVKVIRTRAGVVMSMQVRRAGDQSRFMDALRRRMK